MYLAEWKVNKYGLKNKSRGPTIEEHKVCIQCNKAHVINWLPGKLVPNATKQIAVTESRTPNVQPKWEETSASTAVQIPISIIEIMKQGYPLQISENITQKIILNYFIFNKRNESNLYEKLVKMFVWI